MSRQLLGGRGSTLREGEREERREMIMIIIIIIIIIIINKTAM